MSNEPAKKGKGGIMKVLIWSVVAFALGGTVGYGMATDWKFKQPEPNKQDDKPKE